MEGLSMDAKYIYDNMCSLANGENESKSAEDGQKLLLIKNYFAARVNAEWTSLELTIIQPMFQQIAHLIGRECLFNVFQLEEVMKYKSALVFMSADFPDFADLILDSPLIKLCNSCIDPLLVFSWKVVVPSQTGRYYAYKPSLSAHPWWRLRDDAIMEKGRRISEFQFTMRTNDVNSKAEADLLKWTEQHVDNLRNVSKDQDIEYRRVAEVHEWIASMKYGQPANMPKLDHDYSKATSDNIPKSKNALEKAELSLKLLRSAVDSAKLARIRLVEASKILDQAGRYSRDYLKRYLNVFKQAQTTRHVAEEEVLHFGGFRCYDDVTTYFSSI